MYSISMSVRELRFLLEEMKRSKAQTVYWISPNTLLWMTEENGYHCYQFNGFVSKNIAWIDTSFLQVWRWLKTATHNRHSNPHSIHFKMPFLDITITDQYIECDHSSRFRFTMEIKADMIPQHSKEMDQLKSFYAPVWDAKIAYLKLSIDQLEQLKTIQLNCNKIHDKRKESAFFFEENRLLFEFHDGRASHIPQEITGPYGANKALSSGSRFVIRNDDIQLTKRLIQNKTIDSIFLIPFPRFYILEGRKNEVLVCKKHTKIVG